MTTRRLAGALVLGAGLLGTAAAQGAGDPVAGKFKFSTCSGCHAIPGYTQTYPTYHVPKLGGQHAEYLVAALQAYRAGDRKHPTMHANAASMSDQDMEDIAAYLAQFDQPDGRRGPRVGNTASGRRLSGQCVACHGQDGNSPAPNFPNLAGQYADYLHRALADYASGTRKNAVMKGVVDALDEADLANLAEYFARQPGTLSVIEYE